MAFIPDQTSLDPNAQNGRGDISNIAYEQLVYIDQSGTVSPWIAQKWTATATQAEFTIKDGITCRDGSKFTASDVAQNINFVTDANNKSALNGVAVPAGTKAVADDAARTVTVSTPSPTPFLLYGLSLVWMVCPNGLANPASLKTTTAGTGMYYLTHVSVGNEYDFAKRTNYTWGPFGEKSSDSGLPSKLVLKVVNDETTAANLLLGGQVNAAFVNGPDQPRVASKGYFASTVTSIAGQLWYHQGTGRATNDLAVRTALTKDLDLTKLGSVLTAGKGSAPTSILQYPPAGCPGNSVSGNVPSFNAGEAASALAADGWAKNGSSVLTKNGQQLAINLVYTSSSEADAAAELIQQSWTQLGVKVTLTGSTEAAVRAARYTTGKWDVLLLNLGSPTPDVTVPFFSGAVPPKGVNFADINNTTYNSLVAQARTESAQAGCPLWTQAESVLIKDADVIPFVSSTQTLYSNGTTFKGYGYVLAPSLDMKK